MTQLLLPAVDRQPTTPLEPPPPPPPRNRVASGWALGLALAVAIGGVVGGQHAYEIAMEQQRAKDTLQDLNTVRMALEQFGTDNNGSYPTEGELLSSLSHRAYLPEGRLPPNRWSGKQGIVLVNDGSWAWPKNLNAVAAMATGEVTMSPVGTVLGPGHLPGDGPDDALTYGAILYDHFPDTELYVFYVVGRQGDMAVIIGGTSNTSC